MDGEKQVVIGLLQGLGDGVKLALVAAAVAAVATGRFPDLCHSPAMI